MSGKFWLVLEHEGFYYETVSKHDSEAEAREVATRHKLAHPRIAVYVAAVTHRVELTPDFHTTG